MPTELAGYRTIGQVGVGARSTITRVVRVTTGQYFALKRVVRREPEDDRFLRQCEIEYEVSSGIDHPNLRRSFELHRYKKWFRLSELLMLMEFVPGKTVESDRPADIGRTIEVFKEVASGLNALHDGGFVHADIKPNNILLTDKGGVKIIDFGQSCPMGHKKDRIQGTPDYIAPEQVRRLPLDRRTDVFNLGATLYWVLTNKAYPTDIRQNTKPGSHEIVGAVRAPKDLVPGVPVALSTLVMDCCSVKPEGRPADMTQVIARLEAVKRRWLGQGDDASRGESGNGVESSSSPSPRRVVTDGGEAGDAPANKGRTHGRPDQHAPKRTDP